jgi:eukaryotic-like serine/threonine-protein kinase
VTKLTGLPTRGDVLGGRYCVEQIIGTGGMGAVYRAKQLNLDRPVALKILLPKHTESQIPRARFEREARVAASLHHPNAIEIYDFGEDRGWLYLAMELLRGRTLRHDCPHGFDPLPIQRVLDVGYQVADVLIAVHALPLVHRDVKPDNIFIETLPNGIERAVLGDFGLAFSLTRPDAGRVTDDDIVCGTPVYMSPEQAAGRDLGPPSDIYSLGCVLYELLTGDVPFDGDGAVVLARHLYAPLIAPRERRPDLAIPGALDDLVRRMLAKRPEVRPTAAEAAAALQKMDPDATERRQRSRGESYRLGREARMVSLPPVAYERTEQAEPATDEETHLHVGLVGRIDDATLTALAASGLEVQTLGDQAQSAELDVIYAPGATVAAVRGLALHGRPVVTDASPADLGRLTELLRAGATEVVTRADALDEVVRKLWRAARRRRPG